jgi:Cof subfamily protein (haloacid dehalogenase superfamily)
MLKDLNSGNIRMFVTDYDGTLAHTNSFTSEFAKIIFEALGANNLIRVIATGRSLFSCKQVLPKKFPIDYIVFSSGIGIIDWKSEKIINESHLTPADVDAIESYLTEHNYDFMIQYPVPDNHFFYMHSSGEENLDFYRRFSHYSKYGLQLPAPRPSIATQFIIICKQNCGQFDRVKTDLKDFKVVRATSPLDNKSMWIEIFPKHVSKASGISFLCDKYGVKNEETIVVGNDYNDSDMLSWAQNAYVVDNAVEELKNLYNIIGSNNDDGVANFANDIFNLGIKF